MKMQGRHSFTNRQKRILDLLRLRRNLQVSELSSYFNVSPQTIRQDLGYLDECKELIRTRGGATLPHSKDMMLDKDAINARYERDMKISACVMELIPKASSIFLGMGTVSERIAENIDGQEDLSVFTNSINVARILSKHQCESTTLFGGGLNKDNSRGIGSWGDDLLDNCNPDMAIIDVSSIDRQASLLVHEYDEALFKKRLIKQSSSRVLIVSKDQLVQSAPIEVCHLRQMHHVIADFDLPDWFAEICLSNGVSVKIVS